MDSITSALGPSIYILKLAEREKKSRWLLTIEPRATGYSMYVCNCLSHLHVTFTVVIYVYQTSLKMVTYTLNQRMPKMKFLILPFFSQVNLTLAQLQRLVYK